MLTKLLSSFFRFGMWSGLYLNHSPPHAGWRIYQIWNSDIHECNCMMEWSLNRCKSTSCSICSRICTAVPGSLPPTPLLTYSPSPSPPGTPYLNSETPYLAFSMSSFRSGTPSFSGDQHHRHHHQGTGSGSTSGMGRVQQVQSRRRKFRGDDDEDDEGETVVGVDDGDGDGYEYGFGGLDDAQMWNGAKRHKQLRGSNGDGRGRDEILPGCGRSICKNCCIENTQS